MHDWWLEIHFEFKLNFSTHLYNNYLSIAINQTRHRKGVWGIGLYPNNGNFRDVTIYGKGKGKSVPLQAWTGPEGSRKLRFPDFVSTAQDGGKVCQPCAPVAFTPGKCSWYSFLLEAESTAGS